MINPMLCESRSEPFADDRYLWETKYDGIRIIADIDLVGAFNLQGRSGNDKTHQFPELNLETKVSAILDGELVCYDEEGKLVFKGIQTRANRISGVLLAAKAYPATYEVFDILFADGQDLQHLTLVERKRVLEAVLVPTNNVRVAPCTLDGITLFDKAQENANHYNLTGEILGQKEGIIGKLKIGTYCQGKRDWLKVKTFQSGEFTICGYTEGTGRRASTFGALVLGKYHYFYGALVHVGSVGTGFDEAEINRLYQRMLSSRGADCPFSKEPEKATWIKPAISVLVQYLELTSGGKLRFPSYKGMTN